ncbi:MAG TPA: vitamin K epoxide reductase family protein [Puia sp.]|uniref:vitamin K epoxide reductase family protein n=1 Tax=Puia sp. TaxID=2045100 RepID=UPI002BA6F92F|nr:vitamin K epoxide reductase family protein [Puia sp.]HVU98012.1 vitamin K epoxide reductase family protein [Puia sp.]
MAESFDTALKKVAAEYLRLLNTRVTATSIAQQIENHPDYPSLLSLSEAFTRFHIPNGAFEVGEEGFDELDSPFVAFADVPGIGKDFVLVTGKDRDKVSFRHARKTETVSREEFLKRYQQIVWTAEPDAESGETGYGERLKAERQKKRRRLYWSIAAGAILLLGFFINLPAGSALAFGGITLLKLAGAGTTTLLLAYEVDKSNAFVRDICSAGKQFHCDAVLTSKAARIGGIAWGEIGFFYFGATTLLLFAGGLSFVQKTALLALGNAIAVPYIGFSVYYQWRVLKQWCPLCLIVQAILALEAVWATPSFWSSPIPFSTIYSTPLPLAVACLCLGIAVAGWYGIKPLLIRAKDADDISSAYKRLQYNPDIFFALLQQQPAIPAGWEKLGIPLGPKDAATTIVKVCNPFCGPCSRAHPELEHLLRNYDVQVRIIFNSQNKEADYSANAARHLMAIAEKGDAALTQKALDDWYGMPRKDYAAFAARYPLDDGLEAQNPKLEAMYGWVDAGDIRYTPTLFINGHKLPTHYKLQELKNIL